MLWSWSRLPSRRMLIRSRLFPPWHWDSCHVVSPFLPCAASQLEARGWPLQGRSGRVIRSSVSHFSRRQETRPHHSMTSTFPSYGLSPLLIRSRLAPAISWPCQAGACRRDLALASWPCWGWFPLTSLRGSLQQVLGSLLKYHLKTGAIWLTLLVGFSSPCLFLTVPFDLLYVCFLSLTQRPNYLFMCISLFH